MKALIKLLSGATRWLAGEAENSPDWGMLQSRDMEAYRGAHVVVVVIDTSPSMDFHDYSPTRLKGAQLACRRFLEKLAAQEATALAGMVVFHGRAMVKCPPLPVKNHVDKLMGSLNWISTGAGTNIGDGLRLAGRAIECIPEAKAPRIILLTDGESNNGPNPVDVASELKDRRIQIDIVGIGGSPADINEPDLKLMASVVNGQTRYWFIESLEALVEKFEALALREIK